MRNKKRRYHRQLNHRQYLPAHCVRSARARADADARAHADADADAAGDGAGTRRKADPRRPTRPGFRSGITLMSCLVYWCLPTISYFGMSV